ncbi:PKD domain-containing protein [Phytohabitans flavus]|uniref:PKD domain-containing protein n=1 Tax=Phytohabitans flavus TaxID=1076124 RepID=UPI00362A8506
MVDHAWDFGNNSAVVHGPSANHTYTRRGTYTAWLTVTDNTRATTSASVTVTVT